MTEGKCALCNTMVPADDVAIASTRRVLCLRCHARAAGAIRPVPAALRDQIRVILDHVNA